MWIWIKSKTINKIVDVLKDLISNNNKIELKENIFKNLIDFINNDYNSFSLVDEIIEKNNKIFWDKFKDNVINNVKKKLI